VAAEVDAVTPKQIARLAMRILEPGKAAVAVLGPRAALGAASAFEQALFA
jgi:predicted Zn-dependent peptidase